MEPIRPYWLLLARLRNGFCDPRSFRKPLIQEYLDLQSTQDGSILPNFRVFKSIMMGMLNVQVVFNSCSGALFMVKTRFPKSCIVLLLVILGRLPRSSCGAAFMVEGSSQLDFKSILAWFGNLGPAPMCLEGDTGSSVKEELTTKMIQGAVRIQKKDSHNKDV